MIRHTYVLTEELTGVFIAFSCAASIAQLSILKSIQPIVATVIAFALRFLQNLFRETID
jgi:hypothetical protein